MGHNMHAMRLSMLFLLLLAVHHAQGAMLSTSGSFTMTSGNQMGSVEEDEDESFEDLGGAHGSTLDSAQELGDANGAAARVHEWDLSNAGQCHETDEAWVNTDAKDHTMGKCVKFAQDNKCDMQCYSKGKEVDTEDDDAVCTKICRLPGANGVQCNVIKMVSPIYGETNKLGETGKTTYLTKSKVIQADLTKDNLGEADPMACAGIRLSR